VQEVSQQQNQNLKFILQHMQTDMLFKFVKERSKGLMEKDNVQELIVNSNKVLIFDLWKKMM
jgi:hypothetical protein